MALERPGGVLSLIIRLRNHVCAQAQDQVERRGPNSEIWERERRSEAGRVEEVMQTWRHGPPALRPFPDADAPISCSGNAARLTTLTPELCRPLQNVHVETNRFSRDARPQTPAPASQDGFKITTKGAFENLIAAAKVLASSETIGSVVSLFDKIPDLEASIKSKDEQMMDMDVKMEKEVEKHKTAHKESLLMYDAAKDDLKSEVANSKALVASLQSKIEEKDAAIETLKTDEADLKARIEKLKASVDTQKEKAKKSTALVTELRESVKESKADQDRLQDAFQKQQNLLSQSEAGLKRSQNEYEILRKESSSMSRRLEGMRSLTVSLSDGDPMAT